MGKYNLEGIERANGDNPIKKAPGPKKEKPETPKATKKEGQGGKQKKKDLGRPKIEKEKKLDKKMTLNLTFAEDEIIKKLCKTEFPFPLSASNYIRYKLQEIGVLPKDG